MPDEMVLDTPVDSGIEPVPSDVDASVETPEVQTDQETNTDPDAATRQFNKQIKIFEQRNKFSPEVSKHLAELKKTNPALASAIRQLAFDKAKYDDVLPNGPKEYQELRSTFEELGGETGIENLKHNSTEFSRIDELYTNGDPRFLDELTKEDIGKEAFQRLTPALISKIAEVAPEMYVSNVARETMGWLNEHQIPLMMMRMADLIPKDNEALVATFNHIQKFMNLVGETAKKQPAAPAISPKSGNNGNDEELSRQREENMRLRDENWKSAAVSERERLYDSELRKITASLKPLSEQQSEAVKTLFEMNFKKAIQSDANYAKQLAAFKANGDRDGFLRTARNAFAKYMPDALDRAVKVVNHGAKPGPKPNSQTNGQSAQQKPPTAVPGATLVSSRPKNIDYQRTQQYAAQKGTTAQDLIISRKAVTSDGKLVYWQ